MKDLYFKKSEFISNLYLEQIFIEYEYEPLIFICSDDNNNLYLCINISIVSHQWIIAKTSLSIITNLLNCKIDTYTAIKSGEDTKYVIESNSDFIENTVKIPLSDLNEGLLPKRNFFLERKLWNDGVEEYLNDIILLQKAGGDRLLRRRESAFNNKSFTNNNLNINPNIESTINSELNKRIAAYQHIIDKFSNSRIKSSPCKAMIIDNSSESRRNYDVTIDDNENILPFAS